jgi:hypothetical protein
VRGPTATHGRGGAGALRQRQSFQRGNWEGAVRHHEEGQPPALIFHHMRRAESPAEEGKGPASGCRRMRSGDRPCQWPLWLCRARGGGFTMQNFLSPPRETGPALFDERPVHVAGCRHHVRRPVSQLPHPNHRLRLRAARPPPPRITKSLSTRLPCARLPPIAMLRHPCILFLGEQH